MKDVKGCFASVQITLSPLSARPMGGQTITDSAEQEVNLFASENRESPAVELTPSLAIPWSVSLFLNPNAGNFKVDLCQPATAKMTFGITDQSGRLLLENQVEPGSQIQMVNAESLSAGLYYLQVVSYGKVVAIEKFVKQ